ncbi:heparinase II/III domain-containing protein [Methylobacterium oryzisoli]|uniref:heparinase II/III domain-containing protein n=1 Tax=Methylobacterium oryzisoli TaxID=3385502 RepID=UPI0038914ECF
MPGAIRLLPVSAHYAGGAAVGAREAHHRVPAKNRWSRVVLTFHDVAPETWCAFGFQLSWDPEEQALAAPDFLQVGFDLLAADGGSLDFDHVPGLTRTLLDPQSAWIAGPAYQPAGSEGAGASLVRVGFLMPDPARAVAVSVRSWRNTAPFEVGRPDLLQGDPAEAARGTARRRRRLTPQPDWLDLATVPGRPLILRGQVHGARPERDGAMVRVVYRDGEGAELPPPYPDLVSTPDFGAVVNLTAKRHARRFTLELAPPPGAARVALGFATWEADGAAELLGAPEIALDDALRLESLCGDDLLDAGAFLDRLGREFGAGGLPIPAAGVPLILDRLRALQQGPRPAVGAPELRLAAAPAWPLPLTPTWSEDPFRSVAWRIEYQSLAWLLPLAEADGHRAVALARAWSKANPWGRPTDGLGLHPVALAGRAEVLAGLLGRLNAEALRAEPLRTLAGEALRHGFALAEIIGQNTLARSLHLVHAATALLAVARALPQAPLSDFWGSLARHALREGFASLLDADGAFADPSLHQRLELLSLGRLLAAALPDEPLAEFIAGRVEPVIPAVTSLLDPGGRLPPFGDAPHGIDHAGWIGRLLALGDRALVAERPLAAGRASPAPTRPVSGVIAARSDSPARGFGHFASGFAEQRHPHGHADCTSFVFAAEGVRWIVEGGGSGQVETGAARQYLISPRAHNVAWPDGREPGAGTGRLAASERLDGGTAYALDTNVHGPEYRHRRLFVVLDDLTALAVLDRFETADRPLAAEGLLHLAPDVLVALAGPRLVLASRERQRLRIALRVLRGQSCGLDLVSGRNDRPGALQGFVSWRPGALQPASTLRYAMTGQGSLCGGALVAVDEGRERALAALVAGDAVTRLLAEV